MKFTATKRSVFGSSASRRLRREGRVPAIVYGGEGDAVSIELDHNEIYHALAKEAFHSSVLSMDLEGKKEQVILRVAQWHPYKPLVLHVDFQRVVKGVEMVFTVPLHFEGGDVSPAVKQGDAVISQVLNEIEIECLPRNLPQSITVDLSKLEEDDVLTVASLVLPEGVKVLNDPEETVVIASAVQEEVEEDEEQVADDASEAPEASSDADDQDDKN